MISIIIVEDEPILRESICETTDWQSLKAQVVYAASDAFDGERAIREYKPDIVITDITMPERSGLEMIERLADLADCEFIILSGYDEFEYAQKAMSFGVKAYLLKPVDDAELMKVLQKTIGSIEERKRYIAQAPWLEKGKVQTQDGQVFADLNQVHQIRYLEQLFAILKKEYATDLTLKKVSQELHISESYLVKLIKQGTGFTFLELLTLYRINEAITLLNTSDLRIYEIASEVGYRDARYFSNVFNKIVGVNPIAFRNSYEISDQHVLQRFRKFL